MWPNWQKAEDEQGNLSFYCQIELEIFIFNFMCCMEDSHFSKKGSSEQEDSSGTLFLDSKRGGGGGIICLDCRPLCFLVVHQRLPLNVPWSWATLKDFFILGYWYCIVLHYQWFTIVLYCSSLVLCRNNDIINRCMGEPCPWCPELFRGQLWVRVVDLSSDCWHITLGRGPLYTQTLGCKYSTYSIMYST